MSHQNKREYLTTLVRTEYDVLTATDADRLAVQINEATANHWEPAGDVSVSAYSLNGTERRVYSLLMVRSWMEPTR